MQIQSQPEWTKSRFQNAPQGFALQPTSLQNGYGQPPETKLQLSGSDVRITKSPKKAEESAEGGKPQADGRATKLMVAYKFCAPLLAGLGFGAVFGSSLGFAAGVSLLISSLQSGTVLKIHKGDTASSKTILNWGSGIMSRLMRRDPDRSAAWKEWSMVPVWGVVCAISGLLEATINHTYGHLYKAPSVKDLINKKGFLGPLYRLQGRSMQWVEYGKIFLKNDAKRFLPKAAENLPTWILRKFQSKVQGNAKLGYTVGIGLAGLGGMLQSAGLAKVQERLDKSQAHKHGHPAKTKTGEKPNEKPTAKPDDQSEAKPSNKPAIQPEQLSEKDKKKQFEAPVSSAPTVPAVSTMANGEAPSEAKPDKKTDLKTEDSKAPKTEKPKVEKNQEIQPAPMPPSNSGFWPFSVEAGQPVPAAAPALKEVPLPAKSVERLPLAQNPNPFPLPNQVMPFFWAQQPYAMPQALPLVPPTA